MLSITSNIRPSSKNNYNVSNSPLIPIRVIRSINLRFQCRHHLGSREALAAMQVVQYPVEDTEHGTLRARQQACQGPGQG
jgi:hypothetical protein